MRKTILLLILLFLVSGCAPWIGIHNVELGMTKAEVMQQMGTPRTVTGSGNEEYLYYTPVNRFWENYYVHLVNGKVEAYGQLGGQSAPAQ